MHGCEEQVKRGCSERPVTRRFHFRSPRTPIQRAIRKRISRPLAITLGRPAAPQRARHRDDGEPCANRRRHVRMSLWAALDRHEGSASSRPTMKSESASVGTHVGQLGGITGARARYGHVVEPTRTCRAPVTDAAPFAAASDIARELGGRRRALPAEGFERMTENDQNAAAAASSGLTCSRGQPVDAKCRAARTGGPRATSVMETLRTRRPRVVREGLRDGRIEQPLRNVAHEDRLLIGGVFWIFGFRYSGLALRMR